MKSLIYLHTLNELCEKLFSCIDKLREEVAKQVAKDLEDIKPELEKELGFRILKINIPRATRYGRQEVLILGCYKEMTAFRKANDHFKQILRDYGIPEDISEDIVVGTIAPRYCPMKDKCNDKICRLRD